MIYVIGLSSLVLSLSRLVRGKIVMSRFWPRGKIEMFMFRAMASTLYMLCWV